MCTLRLRFNFSKSISTNVKIAQIANSKMSISSISQYYGVSRSFVHGFIATLSVIIVSELGDKTFFIAAIMAMRHPRLTVLSGAIAALALMHVMSATYVCYVCCICYLCYFCMLLIYGMKYLLVCFIRVDPHVGPGVHFACVD